MPLLDDAVDKLRKAAKVFGVKERPSISPSKRDKRRPPVKFVVMGDTVTIKDPRGGLVTYKLTFLRDKVRRGIKAGLDMSLEQEALNAYDRHIEKQRRKVETEINRRANRMKAVAVKRYKNG